MYVEWACGGMAGIYGLIAWLAASVRRTDATLWLLDPEPVTVLKPLCGAEPHLYECLASFCKQDFPQYQIVFGVSDPADAAIDVVRSLQEAFPNVDMRLSIGGSQRGSNRKVSNLRNMLPHAEHPHLVVADSDISVPPDYLAKVTAPLNDPGVGIVTCAYEGRPEAGLWSRLGALFINDWFIPSARVAALFGSREFAFGATIALRRETLSSIGGFAAIADQLADDYRLGELTRERGLRTVLSECVVQTRVSESTVSILMSHQLRWLRTIRAVRPFGYAFAFLSFSVPVTLACVLMTAFSAVSLVTFAIALLARLRLHRQVNGLSQTTAAIPLMLLSDFLTLSLWCWALFVQHVQWHDVRYKITRDGAVQPVPETGR